MQKTAKKKKNHKPNGIVRCYACFTRLPLSDNQDPDEVVLRHRYSKSCMFSYPMFKGEKPIEIKQETPKKKNKKSKSYYKNKAKKKKGYGKK